MCEDRRPSSTTGTKHIQCPFFVAHNSTEIVCEGIIEGCRCCMKFKEAELKHFHQETFCENQFKRCEMYLSIMHWKWPEE